jgi:hypothetical protein
MLSALTKSTLQQLDEARWFDRVGEAVAEDRVVVLGSWDEAIAECGSPRWKHLQLVATDRLTVPLASRAPERFRRWNDVVEEVKAMTTPLVRRKIRRVVRENDLPDVFSHCVEWDILHACMEAQFADVVPPGGYSALAYWYVSGHFPCGWEGTPPDGSLIVY